MAELLDLSGQRVLVTGASSGIGRAVAVFAAELGATVVLTARRQDELEATRVLMARGKDHLALAGDLTDAAFVADLVKGAGKISGLVHAAGTCPVCAAGALDRTLVDEAFAVNYLAFLELMRHYAKSRNREPSLSVVAVSSVSSSSGWAGGAAYCGSKGALDASVRALAVELAPKGVRVNAVSPSNIRTPLYAAQAANLGGAAPTNRSPLGVGEPQDVAAAVAFLLSPAARFITGVSLPVDGGYLAQ